MVQFGTLFLTALLLQTPSLDSTDPDERIKAVEKMAIVGRTENVAPLAAALQKETKSNVRAAIVAGLGRIGGKEVIPVLAQSLQSDLEKDVRMQTVDAFQRLYIPTDSPDPLRSIFNKVKSTFAEPDRPLVHNPSIVDPAATAALAESMQKDFSQEVRAASARALGSLRARDRVGVLVSTLESPQNREHAEVRLQIVQSLGLIRDLSAGPALHRALNDSDKRISQAAILSIGLIGYKEARPALEYTFRTDRSGESKKRALEAIALLRDSQSQPLLESLLDDTDDTYRELAAEGLARLRYDPNALKSHYDAEKKANVRTALAFGLAISGQSQYVTELVGALNTRQENQAFAYLYELGKFEGQLPELHRHLKNTDARIRSRMVRIVGEIGDRSSRPLVEELTTDKNSEVAAEAIIALRKLTPA